MSVEFDRESPEKFDSRTLSRETLSRWTGRKQWTTVTWNKHGITWRGHGMSME